MRIVFGGAFNGKRKYVKDQLKLDSSVWLEGELPAPGESAVIAGLEQWIRKQLEQQRPEQDIIAAIRELAESAGERIWILTDIGRGIVPLDQLEREWRDVTGRSYQYLFGNAEHITRIWYGIPQTIKGDGRDEYLHENRG
ncbi:bifunctional adenosylcobinamide kinase/adenosylcobinamide-phosphate guanylyltransferase [Planococcus sp. CP5-4]|uniref:bifunctional adenosylcobinamide kinase/adenosylcobinamide-phosphate guanylyltransferase n=1 Tax=unclassified Planococcus (in: firmicutes) TaxID=2662419 RepID=UPI001C22A91C|nr:MULTISPECIES: bifunctional adenosylcobinamide kinase/adenosylcobinamide-phosphate guanylyltransferase [unclassified Planococcus (in: firmicutes)]MBU9673496.1 bifunctional adenosylcobinamide kinase/adenosylcobinamide-phosphate guanylyltransferase [Planococcus sp. CP5-4_YE]MBV0908268.1 bifunctional adenosylcobinamide kinase/adenosylcobinamide-phosphate guanylyltransferase [Planococcus sp. CP5-4_UN]MBW6062330.1 bifunctional adenosylcobinamide kinase/adenosylcobinamide-phosphate guanylyltransfera